VEAVARCAIDGKQPGGLQVKQDGCKGNKHSQGEDFPQKIKVEMDKELSEIRVEIEKLALKM
jgi:hypothetical protein